MNNFEQIKNNIYISNSDCLETMKIIPDKVIDLILTDLPYGVLNKTKNKWDVQLPFELLWGQYERIIKDRGAIVLFGSGMFTADLMKSNSKLWKYNLIWKKGDKCSGFLNARRCPLRNHEDICVFYKKLPIYNPQMEKVGWDKKNHSTGKKQEMTNNCYGNFTKVEPIMSDEKFPKSIINIPPEHKDFYHPSQKPVALLEYLIKTYTNENMVVLDSCMGSGSTGVACINTNRIFIGIEQELKYYNIAKQRLEK